MRLELAGVKSFSNLSRAPVGSVGSVTEDPPVDDLVTAIADKVMDKLRLDIAAGGLGEGSVDSSPADGVNFAGGRGGGRQSNGATGGGGGRQSNGRGAAGRGRGRSRDFEGQRRRGYSSAPRPNNRDRHCRSCNSTEHVILNCPTRFCQACGARGHDHTSNQCPNHQI